LGHALGRTKGEFAHVAQATATATRGGARIIVDDPASLVSVATASDPCGHCGQALPHLERAPDVHAFVALSFPASFTLYCGHESLAVWLPQ
jgi:hypothetical protein